MEYQLIERPIYSEADVLHFGTKVEMGEIANQYFPDKTEIPLGDPLFESEDIEKVKQKKEALEIKRLRAIGVGINCFFFELEMDEKFYATGNFSKLQKLYDEEFHLELIRASHEELQIKFKGEFFIPVEASDELVLKIQKLFGIDFFEIRAVKD